MIKGVEVFIAICDKCGKKYSFDDNIYDVFNTKKEAVEITEGEGWQVKGKKVYCGDCRTY